MSFTETNNAEKDDAHYVAWNFLVDENLSDVIISNHGPNHQRDMVVGFPIDQVCIPDQLWFLCLKVANWYIFFQQKIVDTLD